MCLKADTQHVTQECSPCSYGADSLRLYEMFMGPLRDVKTWSTQSVEGVHRFLARVHRLFTQGAFLSCCHCTSQRVALTLLVSSVHALHSPACQTMHMRRTDAVTLASIAGLAAVHAH